MLRKYILNQIKQTDLAENLYTVAKQFALKKIYNEMIDSGCEAKEYIDEFISNQMKNLYAGDEYNDLKLLAFENIRQELKRI